MRHVFMAFSFGGVARLTPDPLWLMRGDKPQTSCKL